MPTISIVQGVRIIMYLRGKEHEPPHVHAIYQDFEAPFDISTGEVMAGAFPEKQKKIVKHFILLNSKELEEMWETEQYKILPPVS